MTRDEELRLIRQSGYQAAQELQKQAATMTGTELNAADGDIPDFRAVAAKKNMLEWPAGQENGLVCKSTAGRVVRLLQNYDNSVFPGEPEELPAQWRFVWSTDPAKAKPFIALSTSYYNKGDCCLNAAGQPRRSKIDVNTFDPDVSPEFWEDPYGGAV